MPIHRRCCAYRDRRDDFLFNTEQRQRSIQFTIAKPVCLPANLVIGTSYRFEQVVIHVAHGLRLVDGGVAGIDAMFRRKVVGNAEIGDEHIFAVLAVFTCFVILRVVMPVGEACGGKNVQLLGGIDSRPGGKRMGGNYPTGVGVIFVIVCPIGFGECFPVEGVDVVGMGSAVFLNVM